MPPQTTKPESVENTRLRVCLAERGWVGWKTLAARVGCLPDSISRAASMGFPEVLKLKIECALGLTEAIWSTPESLRLRKKVFDAAGRDVATMTLIELQALAKKLGARPVNHTRKSELWRDAILRFAAVNALPTLNENHTRK